MPNMNELYSASSRESEIDALVDELIAKIMSGAADPRDRIEFEELVASRARLMRSRSGRSSVNSRRKYA